MRNAHNYLLKLRPINPQYNFNMGKGVMALCITAMGTIGIISYVHYDQKREIRRMRQGVYLDAERERFRRKVLADKIAAGNKKATQTNEGSASAQS